MTRSELTHMGLALEELERPKAAARQAFTQAQPGIGQVGGAPGGTTEDPARTREVVASALGVGKSTYDRMKSVVAATTDPDPEVNGGYLRRRRFAVRSRSRS